MKMHLPLLLVCALFTPSALVAQSTAFTYQGRLNAGDSPANGLYEMSFALYDAPTNGSVVGTPVTVAPLLVANGLFTATLDFGANAFMGANRWLEISVTVFGSDQPVVTLVQRQPITPTPYAMHAANAAGLMSFVDQALDIKAGGVRALRIEPNGSDAANLIGGYRNNSVAAGVEGAVIGGGGLFDGSDGDYPNRVLGDFGAVLGGFGNTVGDESGVIGGGESNTIEPGAYTSVIGGGNLNRVGWGAYESFIGGGRYHEIKSNSYFSVIGGGYQHIISGDSPYVTIAGGQDHRIGSEAHRSTISGGASNVMEGAVVRSTISGGEQNRIGYYANAVTIGGGARNYIAGPTGGSTISGGVENTIQEEASGTTIAGGYNNTINDNAGEATISGGSRNSIGASSGTIGGGFQNGVVFPGHYAVIGGGLGNRVSNYAATVGGGGDNHASGFLAVVGGGGGVPYEDGSRGAGNTAAGDWSVVGGGLRNSIPADGTNATIGGGGFNRASGVGATVAGGGGVYFDGESAGNTAGARWSTVGGGALNAALGTNSTVGGGSYNIARGGQSTVPGGWGNAAEGDYSFAAGTGAQANHTGSFVWSDASLGAPLLSTTNHQFTARAAGGVRFFTDTNATTGAELAPGSGTWSSLSDRHSKENFSPANPREILDKVAALPMASWNYKAQDKSVRHLGPMAQDFHAAFGLGESERTITTVDADGVSLAAIQGLNAKLEAELKTKDARIAELERRLAGIEKLLAAVPVK